MSTCKVTVLYDVAGHESYVVEGRGRKRRMHLSAGTDRRAPGSIADLSREDFVALGRRLARERGRRVEAIGYVVAWACDELSIENDDDLRFAGAYAYALAKEMHPNSPVSVTVHADAEGGHVHAHIAVLSHDFETGRALTKYRRHREVAALNDRLSEAFGMQVLAPSRRTTPPVASPFNDALRERIEAALADPGTNDWATFVIACDKRGVEVMTAQHTVATDSRSRKRRGEQTIGVTYRALDDVSSGKTRVRRRKGSSLGRSYTYDGIVALLVGRQPRQPDATPSAQFSGERESVIAGGRRKLLGLMSGVLLDGVFSMPGMPGYARAALKVGVRVVRARQGRALIYGFDGERKRWHEHDLPPELGHESVAARLAEVAELRAVAPPNTSELAVSEVVTLLMSEIGQGREAARVRRRPLPKLPPAALRHAELNRMKRASPARSRQLGD